MSEKAKAFAKEGAGILMVAAGKIAGRAIAWGAAGVMAGGLAWTALYTAGWLDHPWEPWRWAVWVLLLLYLVAGGAIMAHTGIWRGVGRTLLYVGIENGYVGYLMDKLLARIESSERAEAFLGDLPLEKWEQLLKRAVEFLLGQPDEAVAKSGGIHRRILGWLRAYLFHKIEHYLLHLVRKEIHATGGGGVSLAKVRTLAFAEGDLFFEKLVQGLITKQLLLGLAVLLFALALPPLFLALARP